MRSHNSGFTLFWFLWIAIVLAACTAAPTPTLAPTQTSTQPPPTSTQPPPTKTATATPQPLTRPKDVYYHMVYDLVTQRLLLIGASHKDVDVWAYDIGSGALTRLKDKPAFYITSIAYNPQAGIVIANNSGTSGVTWRYDPAKDAWQEVATSPSYGENELAPSEFDVESQVMIVMGGDVTGLKETLLYDFAADSWKRAKLDPNPPWLGPLPVAYDAESDRLLIWDGAVVKRIWAFDANTTTWEEILYEAGPKVGCRTGAMAYVPDLDRSYVYCAKLFYAYDYNTNQWEEARGELKPGSREGLSMAYDPLHKLLAIYGGWGKNDLWLYDPQTGEWTQAELE